MFLSRSLCVLAFVSSVFAQNATYCNGGACFVLNIPVATASSGTGDIYFQITGPTSMAWIGIGQGSSMTGSNIFMIYANAAGTNVTLSTRLGVGFRQPTVSTAANAVLLEGSGIANNIMTANIRCSNCNSWSGGSMDFTGSTSNWIYASRAGSSISSNSVSASLSRHDEADTIQLSLTDATGGSSSNPFVASSGSTITPSPSTSGSSPSSTSTSGGKDGDGNPSGSAADSDTASSGSSETSKYDKILMAHAIAGPVAWVLMFPIGAIAMRVLSFRGLVWVHAGWMIAAYMVVLASMGLGVWLAVYTAQLDTYHAIIGLVAVGCMLAQPVTGITHHLLYKKHGRPNAATYSHVWLGRAIITLGMINGGLGLLLSGNTRNGEIIYGAVAGFMWVLWMSVILFAFWKSRKAMKGETGDFVFGSNEKSHSSDGSVAQISVRQEGNHEGTSSSGQNLPDGRERLD